MNNNMNIPKDRQDEILKMASKQLGKDPTQLKKDIESGNLNNIIAGLPPQQASQLKNVLANPQLLNQILSNPQLAKILGNNKK